MSTILCGSAFIKFFTLIAKYVILINLSYDRHLSAPFIWEYLNPKRLAVGGWEILLYGVGPHQITPNCQNNIDPNLQIGI